jgi:hypothetical protein
MSEHKPATGLMSDPGLRGHRDHLGGHVALNFSPRPDVHGLQISLPRLALL